MPEEQNPIQTIPAELSSPIELLKKSFELYKAGFKKFIGMMLVPVLGAAPLIVILALWALVKFLTKATPFINVILGLLGIISVIFLIIVAIISQAGLYILIKDASKNLTIKQAFLDAKKIAWRFFVVSFLTGLFAFLWMLLLIIPGIWAAVNYSFALWIFLYERMGGTSALKRSKEMVKGYWWAVFWRFIFLQILFFIVFAVPSLVITFTTDSRLVNDIWGVMSNVISFLFAPLAIIYFYFMYGDLKRVRGER